MEDRQDGVTKDRAGGDVSRGKRGIHRHASFSLEDVCDAVDNPNSGFFRYLMYLFHIDGVPEVMPTDDDGQI